MCPVIPEEEAEYRAGIYLAQVKNCKLKVSKTSGNEMFEVTWQAVGFDGAPDLCTDYITFSKKSAGLTQAKLGAFGYTAGQNVNAHDLLGKRAHLWIIHEDFNGRPTCKVGMYFESGCRAGYWPESDLPADMAEYLVKPGGAQLRAAQLTTDDDTPF